MAIGGNVLSMIVPYGLATYAVVGLVAASAFVVACVSKVLPEPMSLTFGARLLLLPGAFLLWPYVVVRWLKAGCAHCHVHPHTTA
jgi:hypothetical protein